MRDVEHHVCSYCEHTIDVKGERVRKLLKVEMEFSKHEFSDVSHGSCRLCVEEQRRELKLYKKEVSK